MSAVHPTTIDWPGLTHVWNPVIGCKRDCDYCYAKAFNHRFKWIPKWTEPQFFPEKLKIPKNSRVIKKVFVGSMSDICYWDWGVLQLVINRCALRPGIEFMFCTKDPLVYLKHNWPSNCWLGTTITGEKTGRDWPDDIKGMKELQEIQHLPNKKFISIEPIMGSFYGHLFGYFDLIIVGADSRKHNPIVPKKEWIESIKHDNIHYKENIKRYL